MDISSRIEDYLEAILVMEMAGREATVTELSRVLGVSKATVVAAVRRMVAHGLAEHERYGSLGLTSSGRERALQIYRRHDHLAFLFREVLGFDPSRSLSLACAMEHEMDGESEGRILRFVDFLARCWRENRPWVRELLRCLEGEDDLPRPMALIGAGQRGTVSRVAAGSALRERLSSLGILPGAEVELVARSEDGSVTVVVGGEEVRLDGSEASPVWVCPYCGLLEDCGGEDGQCVP